MKRFCLNLFLLIGILIICGTYTISVYAYVDDSQLELATDAFGEVGATIEYKYPEDTLTVERRAGCCYEVKEPSYI